MPETARFRGRQARTQGVPVFGAYRGDRGRRMAVPEPPFRGETFLGGPLTVLVLLLVAPVPLQPACAAAEDRLAVRSTWSVRSAKTLSKPAPQLTVSASPSRT